MKQLLAAMGLVLAATAFANQPDSVYIFAHAAKDGKTGLRIAWSTRADGGWQTIGEDYTFVSSDFGPWGSGKRMYDPQLLYTPSDGLWHCMWRATATGKTLSYTTSADLKSWKPQVYYSSDDPNAMHIRADVVTMPVGGRDYSGSVLRVPYALVKELGQYVDHRRYREALHNQLAKDDAVRFASLSSNLTDSGRGLQARVSFDLNDTKPISTNLIGIFFEDINYGADGGLYAELVQNRDFEYYPGEGKRDAEWGPLKAWKALDGAVVTVDSVSPIHANNAHYIKLSGGRLTNAGYDGMVLKKGAKYDFSAFVRIPGKPVGKLTVELLDANGRVLASEQVGVKGGSDWRKVKAELIPDADTEAGSIALKYAGEEIQLDMVSLFPRDTFHGHSNGLRADLAQVFADLKPRFVRFPGGCVAHGNGLDNIYDWKGSIGPLESRKPLRNIWGYHQTRGLGYHEYFVWCEDMGAEPLPVLAAGVPCQNSGMPGHRSHDELTTYGQQCGVPMEEMDSYVQDVLDLIEYANGDVKSTWGRKRAENGHPKPFNLKYIGIGNEDMITPLFEERFKLINDAVKAKYPDIKVVGTVGPFYEGSDYDEGWRFATQEGVDLVDEHYYVAPGWYIHNQDYYDNYDRSKPHVYLGEYASHKPGRPNDIETALSVALYLTGVERNADVVELSSYAPLLAKRGHTQWTPDLTYFDNTSVTLTPDYWVQHMYGNNPGSEYIASDVQLSLKRPDADVSNRVGFSAVRDAVTGDLLLRMVNMLPVEVEMTFDAAGAELAGTHRGTILTGRYDDRKAAPRDIEVVLDGNSPAYKMPPYSFTILRIKTK